MPGGGAGSAWRGAGSAGRGAGSAWRGAGSAWRGCSAAAGWRSASAALARGCDTAGMTMTSPEVSPADVAAAHDVLRGVVAVTPLLHSRVLSDRLGGPVFLKCENLQR